MTTPSRDLQIALMTGEMFRAVAAGDEELFNLSVRKGANTQAFQEGAPLLHHALRRAVVEQKDRWFTIVQPHVPDLMVLNHAGKTVFDAATDRFMNNPRAGHESGRVLAWLRRCLMERLPDLGHAPALPQEKTVVMPKFDLSDRPAGDKQRLPDDQTPKPPSP